MCGANGAVFRDRLRKSRDAGLQIAINTQKSFRVFFSSVFLCGGDLFTAQRWDSSTWRVHMCTLLEMAAMFHSIVVLFCVS